MDIHSIETGFFSTDGGAMFGIVSPKVWAVRYPSDEEGRCPLSMRVLFADMGDRKVLFDAGVGKEMPKNTAYYRFHDLKSPLDGLKALGYDADDITDLVFSHLHFDHCCGAVARVNGRLMPVFPNAVYWVGEKQWEAARHPSLWEADAFAPEVLDVLEKTGRLRLVGANRELFPGLRVKLAQGHTGDQLLSYVETSFGTVVYVGDVVPMSPHLLPLCVAAVDNSALQSVDEKMAVLEEAVANDQILFFFHDAATVAVRLKKVNGRISVREKIQI